MGKKFGSKERNRDWTSGLSVNSPLLGFGTVKNSPGIVWNGHKGPCILALKFCELNDLVCVEINLESWSIKELMG